MPQSLPERYGPTGVGRTARMGNAPRFTRCGLVTLQPARRVTAFAAVKRILVIDDDAKLRNHFVELLRLEGYDVSEARNGREGLERARRDVPDLVLCDITMPEMNGHRVLETLRAEPRTAHVPFIFLTGWSEQEDVRTGMNLGADDYLKKPVAPDELFAAAPADANRPPPISSHWA